MQTITKNKRFANDLPSLASKARQAWTTWAGRAGANRVKGKKASRCEHCNLDFAKGEALLKNKKGLSNIVVNLMLIVVSLAAITMTASFLLPFLAQSSNIQESPEYSCIALQTLTNPELEITRACRNQIENRVEIDIVRSALNEIEIQDLTFQLDTSTFACGNSCEPLGSCIIQSPGSRKTYYFPLNPGEQPSSVKIFLNSCELEDVPIRSSC
jgi:hypothetical protein